jgi:hypothetical protein
MLTFGQLPTYQSDETVDVLISDDRRAFSLLFSGFEVLLGAEVGKSVAPIVSSVFSLAVPLEGDGERVEIAFASECLVKAEGGATATLLFSVNGQSTIVDLGANSDQEGFRQEFKFVGARPLECRLSAFLLIGRDSNDRNSQGILRVSSIDAEILPRSGTTRARRGVA